MTDDALFLHVATGLFGLVVGMLVCHRHQWYHDVGEVLLMGTGVFVLVCGYFIDAERTIIHAIPFVIGFAIGFNAVSHTRFDRFRHHRRTHR